MNDKRQAQQELSDKIFYGELKDDRVFSSVLAGKIGQFMRVSVLVLELTRFRTHTKNALKRQIYDREIDVINERINKFNLDYEEFIFFVNKTGRDIYQDMEALQ